ncbi:MAG: hypothetical protein KKD07_00175, partial [Candidatus Omnitrophica bacterium]|nr:hypothetical protein [Candidatus Omnitrophota bacterium]
AQASSSYGKDDNISIKKVIHVLDDVINNDYERHQKVVVYKKQNIHKRLCFYRGRHKVCKIKGHGYAKYKHSPRQGGHYFETCRLK